MKFNVAKCNSIRVTRHYSHKQIIHNYTLHQQTFENVPSEKCLGITITENMDWGQHISDISSKQLRLYVSSAGTWLLHVGVLIKEVAYKTVVGPKLKYAAPIWRPIVKLRFNR